MLRSCACVYKRLSIVGNKKVMEVYNDRAKNKKRKKTDRKKKLTYPGGGRFRFFGSSVGFKKQRICKRQKPKNLIQSKFRTTTTRNEPTCAKTIKKNMVRSKDVRHCRQTRRRRRRRLSNGQPFRRNILCEQANQKNSTVTPFKSSQISCDEREVIGRENCVCVLIGSCD